MSLARGVKWPLAALEQWNRYQERINKEEFRAALVSVLNFPRIGKRVSEREGTPIFRMVLIRSQFLLYYEEEFNKGMH